MIGEKDIGIERIVPKGFPGVSVEIISPPWSTDSGRFRAIAKL